MNKYKTLILWAVIAIGAHGILLAAIDKCVGVSLYKGVLELNNCVYDDGNEDCNGGCEKYTATVGEPTCLWCYDCADWITCPDCNVLDGFPVMLDKETGECDVGEYDSCRCIN